MAVAADTSDLDVGPSLDDVRALAREHTLVPLRHTFIDDCETPVSAYLKLRGEGPSFLLESAEKGQRFGRWSFLGVQPRSVLRVAGGGGPADGGGAPASGAKPTIRTPPWRTSWRDTESHLYLACPRSPAAPSACSATTSSAPPSRPWASRTPTTWASPTSR